MRKIVFYFCSLLLILAMSSCGQKSNDSAGDATGVENMAKERSGNTTAESGGKPVIIDFYATWCGPCKQIAPMFEMLKSEYSDRVEFRSVDVDRDPEMTRKYKVEAMPTFVILDAQGNEIKRIIGADNEGLAQAVDALVGN